MQSRKTTNGQRALSITEMVTTAMILTSIVSVDAWPAIIEHFGRWLTWIK